MSARRRRQYGSGSIYQRSSDGRWFAQIPAGLTRAGNRRVITRSAKTEAEVKRKLDKLQREIARNGIPAAGVGRVTVQTYANLWLTQVERRMRPSAYATTASAVRVWIIPTIGHKPLASLTPGDVRAVAAAIRKAGRKSSTALRAHTDLVSMLRAAMLDGHEIPPRVLLVERPEINTNDRQAMTAAEAIRVLEVAAGLPHASRWVAALLQGMRQGEALGLTWEAVDRRPGVLDVSWQLQSLPYVDRHRPGLGFRVPDRFEARRIEGGLHLTRPKTKAGWRVIPVVPWMATALERWREIAPESPHGLVWPAADGRPADAKEDLDEWKALQATAGVSHPAGRFYVGHEARHTAVTLLLEAGVEREVIERIVGHARLVDAYVHAPAHMAAEALGRVAKRLELD